MSIDNQNKNRDRGLESPKTPDIKVDELLKLESDPQFNQILQEESLNWLKTQRGEEFNREFTGEFDAQGYLIGKDGDSSTKPWQNIGGGMPMLEILERTRNRFVSELPEVATKYPETAPFVKKQEFSNSEKKFGESISEDTVKIKEARRNLGIESDDDPPSIQMTKEGLAMLAEKRAKAEEEMRRQEEKQGELMESFLEREYGAEKESHIEKAKDELSEKGVEEFLVNKPEDKNKELKNKIMDKMEQSNQAGKPLEKEQEEALRQETIGGQEQELKKQKEAESSVVDDMEQPDASELKNEDRESGGENSEQKSAEVALEKIKLYNFSDQVIGLARALRARNEHELTPIIHPGVANYLYSKASSLEEMIQNKRAKPEEIGQAIFEIVGAVDAFGKDVPMTGGVREDSRSLGHVASALENLEESSRNIMIQLGGEEDRNLEDVVGRFKQLVIITEKAKRYAAGKMNLFKKYEEN